MTRIQGRASVDAVMSPSGQPNSRDSRARWPERLESNVSIWIWKRINHTDYTQYGNVGFAILFWLYSNNNPCAVHSPNWIGHVLFQLVQSMAVNNVVLPYAEYFSLSHFPMCTASVAQATRCLRSTLLFHGSPRIIFGLYSQLRFKYNLLKYISVQTVWMQSENGGKNEKRFSRNGARLKSLRKKNRWKLR